MALFKFGRLKIIFQTAKLNTPPIIPCIWYTITLIVTVMYIVASLCVNNRSYFTNLTVIYKA